MSQVKVRSRVRSLGRRGLSGALRQVPSAMFEPMRASFPAAPTTSLRHRAERRLLEVVRHRGLPADLETFTLIDNPNISLVNADSFIVERLYWFGERKGYEPEVIRWWRPFCARSNGILDIGANIGYYAVQGGIASRGTKYTAVEPHPGCARTCRANVALNGLDLVEVVEAAAVAKVGSPEMELHLPEGRDHYVDAPCSGFVGKTEVHHEDVTAYRSITVSTVELRTLCDGVDLIKIDVEGQEHALLSSISGYLRAEMPTVFVEILDDTPKLRAFIADLCATTEYRCFVPTLHALRPLTLSALESVSLVEDFRTRDIILTADRSLTSAAVMD